MSWLPDEIQLSPMNLEALKSLFEKGKGINFGPYPIMISPKDHHVLLEAYKEKEMTKLEELKGLDTALLYAVSSMDQERAFNEIIRLFPQLIAVAEAAKVLVLHVDDLDAESYETMDLAVVDNLRKSLEALT